MLHIDFESRGVVDLRKTGVHAYAEDPRTKIFMCSVVDEGNKKSLWVNPKFIPLLPEGHGLPLIGKVELMDLIRDNKIIKAHNAQFERIMWQEIMVGRYGFDPIPFKKWICTAAKVAQYSLPRALGMAAQALGLTERKDSEGHRIMMKMSKPRKPRKKEKLENPDWENTVYWYEIPEEFLFLCRYCVQDSVTEKEVDRALPYTSDYEQEVYMLDQKINDRGVYVDIDSIDNLLYKVEYQEGLYLKEIKELTGGFVTTAKQVAKMLSWLKGHGVLLPDLTALTVEDALTWNIPDKCIRMLELRQSLSKSSIAKLRAMKNRASLDGRVRGSMLYHGASTGRWSGKGIQPQNLPRDSVEDVKEVDEIVASSVEVVNMNYGCAIQAAVKCIRGVISAAPGHVLYCADYNAIEGRVLAWLAGEEYVLKNYREHKDPYCVFASQIFSKPYEEIKEGHDNHIKEYSNMRFEGKTGELALGYSGWVNAIWQFAPDMEEERAEIIARTWRSNRPLTVRLWKGLEDAAIQAVKTKRTFAYRGIYFGMRGDFLHIKLPSGRMLSYMSPKMVLKDTKYVKNKECVSFWGMNSMTNQWSKQYTYGGKLAENVTQAVSADLLRFALFNAEEDEFPVVLHIHDEVVSEMSEDIQRIKTFDMFKESLLKTPTWAEGLPMAVEGWVGNRYRKE